MILLTNGEAIYVISSKSIMGLNVICMKISVCTFEWTFQKLFKSDRFYVKLNGPPLVFFVVFVLLNLQLCL